MAREQGNKVIARNRRARRVRARAWRVRGWRGLYRRGLYRPGNRGGSIRLKDAWCAPQLLPGRVRPVYQGPGRP